MVIVEIHRAGVTYTFYLQRTENRSTKVPGGDPLPSPQLNPTPPRVGMRTHIHTQQWRFKTPSKVGGWGGGGSGVNKRESPPDPSLRTATAQPTLLWCRPLQSQNKLDQGENSHHCTISFSLTFPRRCVITHRKFFSLNKRHSVGRPFMFQLFRVNVKFV